MAVPQCTSTPASDRTDAASRPASPARTMDRYESVPGLAVYLLGTGAARVARHQQHRRRRPHPPANRSRLRASGVHRRLPSSVMKGGPALVPRHCVGVRARGT